MNDFLGRFHDLGIDLPSGASGNVRVTCPQCTPSRKPGHQRRRDLSVNVDEGVYHCHHCGWSGSIKKGEWTASDPNRDATPRTASYAAPRPLPAVTAPTLWQNAVSYFATRGITEAVLVEKGITASNEFCPMCEGEVGNILFPYYVDGKHINTKHRCGKKHFRMEKGAQRVFYNLDAIAGHDTVIIVEGEFDALAMHAAGLTNVISVPDGAPAPDATNYSSKFSFLEAAEDALAHVKRFIMATDADAPGQKLMNELARRIGPEKCSRVTWDEGVKDANEALIAAGPDYLRILVDEAEPFPVEGILTANDVARELDDLYDNGVDRGLEIDPNFKTLNRHYRIKPGYMSIVTGIPSHGKSGVIDNVIVKLAENHGWAFTIFSPEQQPAHKHFQHLIEIHAGAPMLDGPTPRMSKSEMHAARRWVAERFSILTPDDPSIENILELARVEVYRRGIKGMVVDPWNELEHMRPRHMSETEYISSALSQFRRFAAVHQIHVWIVAHPTKLKRNDDQSEPIPTLYDIAGSANFRNKADIGISVWRDLTLNDPQVQFHITKMRYADQGQLGAVQFRYDAPSKRIFDVGEVKR